MKKSLWWLSGEQTREKNVVSMRRPAYESLWKSRQEMAVFKNIIVIGEIEVTDS